MAKSILLHTQKSVCIAEAFGDYCNIDEEYICCTVHYSRYLLALWVTLFKYSCKCIYTMAHQNLQDKLHQTLSSVTAHIK